MKIGCRFAALFFVYATLDPNTLTESDEILIVLWSDLTGFAGIRVSAKSGRWQRLLLLRRLFMGNSVCLLKLIMSLSVYINKSFDRHKREIYAHEPFTYLLNGKFLKLQNLCNSATWKTNHRI